MTFDNLKITHLIVFFVKNDRLLKENAIKMIEMSMYICKKKFLFNFLFLDFVMMTINFKLNQTKSLIWYMHLYANKWNKIIDKTVFMHILETKFETILWAKKIINTCNSWKILLGEKQSMCGTSIIQRNFWEKKLSHWMALVWERYNVIILLFQLQLNDEKKNILKKWFLLIIDISTI